MVICVAHSIERKKIARLVLQAGDLLSPDMPAQRFLLAPCRTIVAPEPFRNFAKVLTAHHLRFQDQREC